MKRKEPSSEELYNFSRVTPAQLAYISFPADGRYQPVRPVSTRPAAGGRAKSFKSGSVTAEKYAGGGGILILEDQRPDEAADYLVFETQTPLPDAAAQVTAEHATESRWERAPHIDLDPNASEADPPQPFEVRDIDRVASMCSDCPIFAVPI